MFSSNSFGEWTEVSKDVSGNTFYLDFERIRKVDGYVYYWFLVDLLKPRNGVLSSKTYNEGDCKLFRWRDLQFVNHKKPMGVDTGESFTNENPKWSFPPPNSINEFILEIVCRQ